MATSKMSRVEKLHRDFTETLITALQAGADTPSATLSVIRSFLADAGLKPVSDSPAHQRLINVALPFTATDERRLPSAYTNEKAN
jgi:hypothetical protein